MKKHQRNQNGSAIRYRDTRHGKIRIAKLRLIQRAILHGLSAVAMAQIDAIKSTKSDCRIDQAKKAAAIARVIIDESIAMANMQSMTRQWFA